MGGGGDKLCLTAAALLHREQHAPGEKPGEDSQEEECGGGRSQEQKILPPGQGFLVCKWIQGGHTEGVPLPGDHGYGRVIAVFLVKGERGGLCHFSVLFPQAGLLLCQRKEA